MKYSEKYMAIEPSVTLAISAKEKKMKSEGIDVIGFSVGEPDFQTPDNIRQAAIEAIEKKPITYTASSGLPLLKRSIVEKLRKDNDLLYDPAEIVVSNGAKHSLRNAIEAISNPGDEIIVPVPYWVSYVELVKMSGALPVLVEGKEESDFKVSAEQIRKACTDKTKAIILNSPSNPTGAVYSERELREIASLIVEKDLIIISDEIYEKLIYEGKHISIASFSPEIKERTILVNGMSKAYAMTGWRIGYTASNKILASMMDNIQSHATSNPNTVAQYASIEALEGKQDSLLSMKKEFHERRDLMVKEINDIDLLSCNIPSGAFYVMVNISKVLGKTFGGKTLHTSIDFADYLLDQAKVAVVPGIAFGADRYIRLSYATSKEKISEGVKRIRQALS
ncbi:MAG: pyridoxal phosphate-dependent aminotransferase [Peptostreptococcaceae bacterium]|nr:pyridoxal phosphate-dependent aminotransferase [Peptostreptococcaceae bacterium]